MNRQIKFRGWNIERNEWVYGYYRMFGDKSYITEYGKPGIPEQTIEVVGESCGQFTGLHDMNNKAIYEGDMLVWSTGDYGVVEWSDGDAEFLLEIENHRDVGCVGVGGFTEIPILNGLSSSKVRHYAVVDNVYEKSIKTKINLQTSSDSII